MKRLSAFPDTAFWVAEESRRPRFNDHLGTHYQGTSDAFYQLVKLLCPQLDKNLYSINASRNIIRNLPGNIGFYPRGIYATVHTASPELEETLNTLFISIQAAIDKSQRIGAEHGKNLLLSLASGTITIGQVNDKSIHAQEG